MKRLEKQDICVSRPGSVTHCVTLARKILPDWDLSVPFCTVGGLGHFWVCTSVGWSPPQLLFWAQEGSQGLWSAEECGPNRLEKTVLDKLIVTEPQTWWGQAGGGSCFLS